MSEQKQVLSKAAEQRRDEAERSNLMDILEHVIVVGNHHRHVHARYQEYERKKLEMMPSKGRKLKDPLPPSINVQTFRLAPTGSLREPQPWPKRRRIPFNVVGSDADDVDPVAFASQRLSKQAITSKDPALTHADPLRRPRDASDRAKEDFSRAFLLHCWHRAVHAASTTIHVNVGSNAMDTTTAAPRKERTRQMAIDKCRSLGLSVKNNSDETSSSRPCASCGIRFDDDKQLDQHFFGSDDNKVLGCCWLLIRNEQRRLVDRILRTEVKNQTDNLLHLLLVTSAVHLGVKKQVKGSQKNIAADESLLFRWDDVIECLESHLAIARHTALEASSSTTSPRDVVQQTLETGGYRAPLVLNAHVLESVVSQLVSRYGKVPR